MYTALNLESESIIVILAPFWRERIDTLRRLAERDALVCKGCRQPVRERAGEFKRWHFAHKHLENCSYGSASPAVLEARAVLYGWLEQHFGGAVTLEKDLPGLDLPRPIDAWVETANSSSALAFWIIDSRLTPPSREALLRLEAAPDVKPVWLLLAGMRQPDPQDDACLYLSTTERAFARATPMDRAHGALARAPGKTLSYLDAPNATLTTYRALRLIHSPQQHRGVRFHDPLADVLPALDGGFMHPAERGALERAIASQDVYRRARRAILSSGQPEAVCVLCGAFTRDYDSAWLDSAWRYCRCRECLSRSDGSQ